MLRKLLTRFALPVASLLALSVSSQAQTAKVVNAFSGEADSAYGAVARGGFWKIIFTTNQTQRLVTHESADFNPWVTTTPGGLRVELTNCDGTSKDLPIVKVFTHTTLPLPNRNEITVYAPNNVGNEPYGNCSVTRLISTSNITLHAVPQRTDFSFSFNNSSYFWGLQTASSIPGNSNYDVPNGLHFNATTGVWTQLKDCFTSATCPISTGGVYNYLVLYGTGAERLSCNNSDPDSSKWCSTASGYGSGYYEGVPEVFLENDIGFGIPKIEFHGQVYLGVEQTNIRLTTGTPIGEQTLFINDRPNDFILVSSPLREYKIKLHEGN